jgi:hypothetical protein
VRINCPPASWIILFNAVRVTSSSKIIMKSAVVLVAAVAEFMPWVSPRESEKARAIDAALLPIFTVES